MKMDIDIISKLIDQFDNATKKPENYLSVQDDQAEDIKKLTRNLYNFNKKKENPKKKPPETLNELILKDLDEEQIWQQVELQNNSIYDILVNDVSHLLAKKDNLEFPLKTKKKEKSKEKKDDFLLLNGNESDVKEHSLDDDSDKEDFKMKEKKKRKKNKSGKPSIVDDKFFKLHDMETFLEKWEKDENYDSDDEEIDYFEDDSDPDDVSEKQLHYNDFFDQPDDEVQKDKKKRSNSESEEEDGNKKKKVKFDLNEEENDLNDVDDEEQFSSNEDNNFDGDLQDDSEHEEGNDVDDSNNDDDNYNEDEGEDPDDDDFEVGVDDRENDEADIKKTEPLSKFEARQERLKLRISALEEEALREKPWQLKGEITAQNRPQNSLLQEYVEFDVATRPAPIITEKSTLKLEDIISQRIKDKAWDDVVRKIKPVDSEIEYKKKLVLDQEKSKLSLAQIYEQEYLNQLSSKTEDSQEKPEIEPPEYQEIRIMMKNLFYKLDALCNFHFTPKQVDPEIKIISNLPAITMEEVAPVAASDATLLAPEEIKPKSKGELIGKSERTATDKKRERRQKKLKQKFKHKKLEEKAKEKLEEKDSKIPLTKKISEKFLQRITKSNNVTQTKESEGGKYVKSSNAFFSKLQDDTRSKLKKKGFELKQPNLGKKLKSKKSKNR